MSQLISSGKHAGNGQGDPLRRLVAQVPDMKQKTPHRWQWTCAGHAAEVRVEPGEAIRILIDVPNPPPPKGALKISGDLPGNLRLARNARRYTLLADTRLDGEIHLAASFAAVQAGARLVLNDTRFEGTTQPIAAEEVQSAIDDCRWPDDQVVQLEDAWEFRPRLRGDATPVQVAIERDQLRLYRTVVANLDLAGGEAVAEQALRFNDQLRHARLAMAGEALVAEARLHRQQLTPAWLEVASRAVAVACRFSEEVLNVLADNSQVAEQYAAMFPTVTTKTKGRRQRAKAAPR